MTAAGNGTATITATLANLRSLTLRYNQLGGSIPPELGSLASLQDLDLAGNRLSGRYRPKWAALPG